MAGVEQTKIVQKLLKGQTRTIWQKGFGVGHFIYSFPTSLPLRRTKSAFDSPRLHDDIASNC
jgi:hypothetical protein